MEITYALTIILDDQQRLQVESALSAIGIEGAFRWRKLRSVRTAPRATPDVPPAPSDAPALISEPQRKRLFALCREHNVEPERLKDFLFVQHGFASSRDVTKAKYELVCQRVERGGK